MAQTTFDLADLKRRMAGAVQSFKGDLASLRSGRASANMLDPITVEAYGARTPLSQLATVSVPEPRLLSVQVWDRSMVNAVDKAVRESDLGLNPQTEGQVLRIRIPEWAGYTKVRIVRERGDDVTEGRGMDPSSWVQEHFLLLGEACEGEKITVTFPLDTRTTVETAIGQTFLTQWRGDDVVGISPEGRYHPFYSGRQVFDTAPMREGEYQRPSNEIVW